MGSNKRDWLLGVLVVFAALTAARGLRASDPPVDTTRQLCPMGSLWNAAAPTASASLFAVDLTVSQRAGKMTILACLKVTGPLYLVETANGVSVVSALNDGNSLTAFHDYGFVIPTRKYDEGGNLIGYNFQLGSSTNGGVGKLRCDEILAPVD